MKKTLIAMAIVALTACNAKHDNPVLQDSSLPRYHAALATSRKEAISSIGV